MELLELGRVHSSGASRRARNLSEAGAMPTTLSVEEPRPFTTITAQPATRLDERRSTRRASRRLTAYITAMGCTDGVCCATENMSEEGLYVLAPAACGLQLGQRCEVVLREEPGASLWSSYSDSGCYATIVRTESISHSGTPMLGAGLRFDQPFYW